MTGIRKREGMGHRAWGMGHGILGTRKEFKDQVSLDGYLILNGYRTSPNRDATRMWDKGRIFQCPMPNPLCPIPNPQSPLLQKPNHVQEAVTGNQLYD